MKYSYIIINNDKIYIKYNNDKIEFYKRLDKQIVKISKQEEKNILKIINENYGYNYYSKKLTAITYLNKGIEEPNYILTFLNWLEEIIPENCRHNIYNNLKTLDTNLNLKIKLNEVKYEENYEQCHYNSETNSLVMGKVPLKKMWEKAKLSKNPQQFYTLEYSQALLHELCHMASSNYNKETGITQSGFDEYPCTKLSNKNRGLTEGFTEVLSCGGVPGTIECASEYYIEILISRLLICLVGIEVFKESYFNNNGTKLIEEELYKIIPDKVKIYHLFREIETNFQFRKVLLEQNILTNIQNTILDFLDKKCEELDSKEEIDEIMSMFDNFIITNDKLEQMGKNPKNYIGIEDNLTKLNSIKDKYNYKKTI